MHLLVASVKTPVVNHAITSRSSKLSWDNIQRIPKKTNISI